MPLCSGCRFRVLSYCCLSKFRPGRMMNAAETDGINVGEKSSVRDIKMKEGVKGQIEHFGKE